jgi:hypothetical protein
MEHHRPGGGVIGVGVGLDDDVGQVSAFVVVAGEWFWVLGLCAARISRWFADPMAMVGAVIEMKTIGGLPALELVHRSDADTAEVNLQYRGEAAGELPSGVCGDRWHVLASAGGVPPF